MAGWKNMQGTKDITDHLTLTNGLPLFYHYGGVSGYQRKHTNLMIGRRDGSQILCILYQIYTSYENDHTCDICLFVKIKNSTFIFYDWLSQLPKISVTTDMCMTVCDVTGI